ncbi:polysaccharide biosynthesis tyrosine autokinase [Actinomycetospora aeridis]|uniref:non-specific protein-tyrosine kinase n=1 Tax=Actinomycetospora aeridis TaxID=3129231 RepID=A0ABU8N6F8_9PSEU
MTFKDYLQAVRKNWRTVVAVFLIVIAAFSVATIVTPPRYTSSATIYLSTQTPVDNATVAYQGSLLSEQKISTYEDLATSARVLREAAASAGLPPEAASALASSIQVTVPTESVLLIIDVTTNSSDQSAAIANGVAASVSRLVEELERPQSANQAPLLLARVVEGAVPNPVAVFPSWSTNILLGALTGLLLGLTIAIGREYFDNTVHSVERFEDKLEAPFLGSVRKTSGSIDGRSLSVEQLESYRHIRTNITFVDFDQDRKVILFTSAVEGEGKTTTATNIARALAEGGSKVLIIDADLRRPEIAKAFALEAAVGLSTVLSGRVTYDRALQRPAGSNIDVLTSGKKPPNPSELLGSSRMAALLEQARDRYDYVLVDAPPVLPVTDASVLSLNADGAIVVCRYGKTTSAQLSAAAASLRKVGGRILGGVLSMTPKTSQDPYHSYGGKYGQDVDGPPSTTSGQVEDATTAQLHSERSTPSPVPRGARHQTSSSPTPRGNERSQSGG